MSSRTVLAFGLGLVLFLTGCGDDGTGARPAATQAAPPAPAHPLRTAEPVELAPPPPSTAPLPVIKPRPGALPPGLQRTTGTRAVALTFDDGPDPLWTPKVLDQLRAARVTATFCLIGGRVQQYPRLVARIVREGHQLCNHSWRHDMDLGSRPVAEIRADLSRTNRAIKAAVPKARISFYRQPGGRWTPEVVAVARELGMRSLHWSVDPQDWAKPTGPTIRQRVRTAIRPGSIVLLHDGGGDRSATLAACPRLIADAQQRYGVARLR